MALFKLSTWGIAEAWRDVDNYFDWIRTIKNEKFNQRSKYNIWKLNHNIFYTLYFTLDIDETEAQLPEDIKRARLIESLAPLHRYLDEELGFAGSLVPEFNQFIDDQGQPTLTYLIVYRFAFNRVSIQWALKWLVVGTLGVIAVNQLHYFTELIQWLKNLT